MCAEKPNEIEVTPEMELAGGKVLCDHYEDMTTTPTMEGGVAREVFSAMLRAIPSKPRPSDRPLPRATEISS